jgi:hypothetical protein
LNLCLRASSTIFPRAANIAKVFIFGEEQEKDDLHEKNHLFSPLESSSSDSITILRLRGVIHSLANPNRKLKIQVWKPQRRRKMKDLKRNLHEGADPMIRIPCNLLRNAFRTLLQRELL